MGIYFCFIISIYKINRFIRSININLKIKKNIIYNEKITMCMVNGNNTIFDNGK